MDIMVLLSRMTVSVRLDGVRHAYGGGRRPAVEALGPIDLEIGPGEH